MKHKWGHPLICFRLLYRRTRRVLRVNLTDYWQLTGSNIMQIFPAHLQKVYKQMCLVIITQIYPAPLHKVYKQMCLVIITQIFPAHLQKVYKQMCLVIIICCINLQNITMSMHHQYFTASLIKISLFFSICNLYTVLGF
jgi:hypothetical protein